MDIYEAALIPWIGKRFQFPPKTHLPAFMSADGAARDLGRAREANPNSLLRELSVASPAQVLAVLGRVGGHGG